MSGLSSKFRLSAAHPDYPLDGRGNNYLHLAVAAGDVAAVARAIEAGARLRLRDADQRSPAMAAVAAGREDILRLLVAADKGVLEDVETNMGTPLMMAVTSGQPALARLMVAAGADVNACDGMGRSALWVALVQAGQEATKDAGAEIAALLIDGGADIEGLHLGGARLADCIRMGHDRLVAALLARLSPQALNETTDSGGMYPLERAVMRGEADLVRALLARGALCNIANDHGAGAAHRAITRGDAAMLELLVREGGADLNHVPQGGKHTALQWALMAGNPDMVAQALALGADPFPPRDQLTFGRKDVTPPLVLAAARGSQTMAQMLLETEKARSDLAHERAVVRADYIEGIYQAIVHEHAALFRQLVTQAGAFDVDLGAEAAQGGRLLVAAMEKGNATMVRGLLDSGVAVGSQDGQGRSALDIAREKDAPFLLEVLRPYLPPDDAQKPAKPVAPRAPKP